MTTKKAGFIDTVLEKIKRGTVEILPEKELRKKLEKSQSSGKPLVIKAGFDPTAPDLHLGHLVLLRKLKHFQDLGHRVHFLIGDFTAMIGDPSGRSQTRPALTQEEVSKNSETYRQQVFRILEESKTEICYNSKWCEGLDFAGVLALTTRYTVAQILERDDFMKRYKAGNSISLVEFMYPLIQGYDSVQMQSDIEIGGSDQKFNLLVGRELQSQYQQESQVVITLPLLVGLDGQRKMSKSYGNAIGLEEAPYSMFAKCMSISDELMWDYFALLTDVPQAELGTLREDPLAAKKYLAYTIVYDLHGKASAEQVQSHWENEKSAHKQQKMVLPPDVPEYTVAMGQKSIALIDVFIAAGIEESKSAIRRLVQSAAVKMGDDLQVIEDPNYELSFPRDYVFKIGKKRYLKVHGE